MSKNIDYYVLSLKNAFGESGEVKFLGGYIDPILPFNQLKSFSWDCSLIFEYGMSNYLVVDMQHTEYRLVRVLFMKKHF